MSANVATAGPHPDDGALVRLLDREGSAAERAQLAAHVDACEVCHRRQRVLATWSQGTSELLARADAPLRAFPLSPNGRAPRAPWQGWAAVAAALLLVLGTGALAAPVRTWIAERSPLLRQLLHVPAAPSPLQTPAPTPALPVGEVSFTPDSDVLLVRVATRQAAGSLVLETSAAPTASATVRGQGEHEAVVVLPDELRIANTATSRATYHLTLPRRLTRVVVVIDGDRALSLAPVGPGESRVIDLRMKGRR